MPPDLARLLDPARTALVTNECQNGVIGEEAIFPALAEAARAMIPGLTRLTKSARAAGVPVIHCVAHRRPDGKGASTNARLFGAAARSGVVLAPGSTAAALHPAIASDESDIVLARLHGIGPMWGTDLDPVLRALGRSTVVVAGVSVNVGIINLVMDAVNAGYDVVLARDAVAGVGDEYVQAVLDNTLSLLATLAATEEIVGVWR